MAKPERVQSPRRAVVAARYLLFVAVQAALFLALGRSLFEPVGTDVTQREIKHSAHLPVMFWCLSAPLMWSPVGDKLADRFAWTNACLLLLLHIAIAFHLGHGWSHQAAWEHTRQVGGYGDGIFVNYAFALVWLTDVIWLWVSPGSYFARPRWLHWAIHGFIAFVMFNAAVVFADWGFRITFLGWVLVFALFFRYLRRQTLATQTDVHTGNTARPANPESGAADVDRT